MRDMAQPFFSVVIPTYNRAGFIATAVQSVIDQTFRDWELIVVDDASTDDTQDVLRTFRDARIQILRNETNLERSASRNRGIAEARGQYICFLDSDDYYLPNHLSTLRSRIEEMDDAQAVVVLSCRRQYPDRSVDVLTASRLEPDLTPVEQVIAHHIPVNTLAIPRSRLPTPAFDSRFRINEDVRLFAQLAASGLVFHYFDDITSVWVCEGQNTASQEGDCITPQLECMRDLFGLPEIRANTRGSFRRQHLGGLCAQLSHARCERGERSGALAAAVRALLLLRGDRTARSALGHVLYSLPGGQALGRLKRRATGRSRKRDEGRNR